MRVGQRPVAVAEPGELLPIERVLARHREGADQGASRVAFGADRGNERMPMSAEIARDGPHRLRRGRALPRDVDLLARHGWLPHAERGAGIAPPQRGAGAAFVAGSMVELV